jgi:hypothetical protein
MRADYNPYAAPDVEVIPPTAPPAARSGVPLVFGILSIVFSGLMILMVPASAGMQYLTKEKPSATTEAKEKPSATTEAKEKPSATTEAKEKPSATTEAPSAADDTSAASQREAPETPAGVAICLVLGLVGGNIALLILGIGQVRYRRWAARGTVIWSIVAPGLLVAAMVWNIAGPASTLAEGLALLPAIIMLLPYPILLLVFFTRPRVLASMK